MLLVTVVISKIKINDADNVDSLDEDRGDYEAVASWLIFTSVMAVVTESITVGLRFLNVTFVNAKFALVGLMVSVGVVFHYFKDYFIFSLNFQLI